MLPESFREAYLWLPGSFIVPLTPSRSLAVQKETTPPGLTYTLSRAKPVGLDVHPQRVSRRRTVRLGRVLEPRDRLRVSRAGRSKRSAVDHSLLAPRPRERNRGDSSQRIQRLKASCSLRISVPSMTAGRATWWVSTPSITTVSALVIPSRVRARSRSGS